MLDPRELFRSMCLMSGMFPKVLNSSCVDAIFVWGRAADEWQSSGYDEGVLKVAARLHKTTTAPVFIPGYRGSEKGQGVHGYPGPQVWQSALRTLGVTNAFATAGNGHNTKTEMDELLDIALRESWQVVIGVTQQAHALRAMLGTVKSLASRGVLNRLTVVPVWPHTFSWDRTCHGSQGVGPYSAYQWIDEEWGRIPCYQAQQDLATFAELNEYLLRIYAA